MNLKVTVSPRWYGPIPTRNGKNLPANQWARAGRKRKWAVRWYAPDGSRPRRTLATKEQAEAFARDRVAEFEARGSQSRIQPAKVTLGEFVDELERTRTGPRGQHMSIGTLREYKHILNRFANFVGRAVPLACVTMADATRYLADLRSPDLKTKRLLSVSTVNKHKANLKSAFNVAVSQFGHLNVNPFAALKLDRVAAKEVQFVTPKQFGQIVKSCGIHANRALWWEAYLTVCYTAALRANEATHLTWTDIDFENNSIRVVAKGERGGLPAWRPKDYDPRTIPVPPATIDLLARLQAAADAGSDFVFLPPDRVAWIRSKRDAGTWREGQDVVNNLNRDFNRITKAAGVHNVSLHDLRRSAISHWARKLAAPIVMELAGHTSIATTLRYYVSIRDSDMAEAREVIATAMQLDPN